MVARLLQSNRVETTRAPGGATWLVVLMACLTSTSCIFPPPTIAEQKEPNLPPLILDANPSGRTVRVESSARITLSVRPADLNVDPPDERLFYTWLGAGSGIRTQGNPSTSPLLDQPDPLEGAADMTLYETIRHDVDPCDQFLRPLDQETIWVFVSDRTIEEFEGDTPRVPEDSDGFIDSWSWVLEFEPGICQ